MGSNIELTIQAHGHPPCPSGRDSHSAQRLQTRSLMEDWKPWLDVMRQMSRKEK